MYNEALEHEKEAHVPLLPFGETLRPLILTSSLSDYDLKFVLQKRGIFIKDRRKDSTIPKLTTILLSPREFDILKNRQQFKESTVKMSDVKTSWNSEKTVLQAIPDDCEVFVNALIDEHSPYKLTQCDTKHTDPNEVIISCSIKRYDWKKDVFSQTSYHDCTLTIIKEPESDALIYRTETTATETKDFMNKLKEAIHHHFQSEGVIAQNTPMQRILANYFVSNKTCFEFLQHFIEKTGVISFRKIVNIDVGIDHHSKEFPKEFEWLKENVDVINLHGDRIHETDVMMLGKIGVLEFGEIETAFGFAYPDAKGTCVIKYGFPKSYNKREKSVEFEAKVISLTLHPDYAHVAKNPVQNFLLKQFQKEKHKTFEKFKDEKKVDTRPRNSVDQCEFEF
jgi:hypothetical protein